MITHTRIIIFRFRLQLGYRVKLRRFRVTSVMATVDAGFPLRSHTRAHTHTNSNTHMHTHRHTDRQTDRQTDKNTDTHTPRSTAIIA